MKTMAVAAFTVYATLYGSAAAQNVQDLQARLNATDLCEGLHLNNAQEGLFRAAIDKNYHTIRKLERNGDKLTFEGELACQLT